MLNPASDEFLAALQEKLPQGAIASPEPRYLQEPRGIWHGQAAAVVKPQSTKDVSLILSACHKARIGVVPYGGGTGLVGGQIMPQGGPVPIILSLEKMANICAVWPDENAMAVEAGAILADVQAAAAEAGRLFALSLASEGSARIGGLLGTNAGGVNVLRYGNVRDQVLGIEAVLPDGTVIDAMKRLRKDNTGYDLRHLMIGAEGSLGVITAAVLKLNMPPVKRATALITVSDPAAAVELLSLFQKGCGETISAFELINGTGLEFLRETMPQIKQPLDYVPAWSVLVEIGTTAAQDPAIMMEAAFEQAAAQGIADDGVIAQSDAQRAMLWTMRETIPLANRAIGAVASHDISVPISVLAEFITKGRLAVEKIAPLRLNAFGHLGDGNLHFNVFPPKGQKAAEFYPLRDQIYAAVHDLVHSLGGSVSAEHGIGRKKTDDLLRYGDAGKLAAMRAIKSALDPHGIMNPGAVLTQE